jgi:pullulanase
MDLNAFPETKKKLGALYAPEQTTFNVWAPTQEHLSIAVYTHPSALSRTVYPMTKDASDGVFTVTVSGDLHKKYYTLLINDQVEIVDPYAESACSNSRRGAVIDHHRAEPKLWETHKRPAPAPFCDAVLYELHLKDFTGDKSSGAAYRGKYLGLTESNTRYKAYATGLDHLADLGITHAHFMPVFDYLTVDETDDGDASYNWGYDPALYNVPEGSYSVDPDNPASRVEELKSAIQALQTRGIKVVLDVVYNHTYRSQFSNFNTLVPGYYYRLTDDGTFSNGSGCGNEFASEHPMARQFIIDSLCHWAEVYKVDGFRFDLMALIDSETIFKAQDALNRINPDIKIYGEPWTGGLSTLPDQQRIHKGIQCGKSFALFNDDFRNALKGDNDGWGSGFIQGNLDTLNAVMTGIAGSIPYDDYHIGFAETPCETINYFNAHDNLILQDKLFKSVPNADIETLTRLNKLAFGILLTSQGVPFFHAGNEFMRDKKGHENSYNAPMDVNGIRWENKAKHYGFYMYVKELIALRKAYPCLRMQSADEIKSRLRFYMGADAQSKAIVYSIKQAPESDFNCLLVVHNPQKEPMTLSIQSLIDHMCENMKGHPASDVRITCIFDEDGAHTDEVPLDTKMHHFLRVGPISTTLYKFKLV